MRILVCDTETTGLDKPIKVTELAAVECETVQEGAAMRLIVKDQFATLVNPLRHITAEASSVTGITDAMVKEAPPISVAVQMMLQYYRIPVTSTFLVLGHNFPKFDMELLSRFLPPKVEVGCTLKAARRHIPDAPGHSLDKLRQHCELPSNGNAHRALADCLDTVGLINYMLGYGMAWEALTMTMCERIANMPWGKHKGQRLENLDPGYLKWVRDEADATSWDLRRAVTEILEDLE